MSYEVRHGEEYYPSTSQPYGFGPPPNYNTNYNTNYYTGDDYYYNKADYNYSKISIWIKNAWKRFKKWMFNLWDCIFWWII